MFENIFAFHHLYKNSRRIRFIWDAKHRLCLVSNSLLNASYSSFLFSSPEQSWSQALMYRIWVLRPKHIALTFTFMTISIRWCCWKWIKINFLVGVPRLQFSSLYFYSWCFAYLLSIFTQDLCLSNKNSKCKLKEKGLFLTTFSVLFL